MMRFDPVVLSEKIDLASPTLSRKVAMIALGLVSPFNSHLKASLLDWKNKQVRLSMSRHRSVKNHVGGIHAGALFTLGESCAGLLILRNFSFSQYRFLIVDAKIKYNRQARGQIFAQCALSEEKLKTTRLSLKKGKFPLIKLSTVITDQTKDEICRVDTAWQIKPWAKVKIQ